ENLSGELEIPDHPLVRQAVRDCLEDAMDIEGLEGLLRGLESGAIRVVARDLTEPSPLALEVLSARPYAFLDDAPLEERRTQAVLSRRWLDPEAAGDLGALDPAAIARVRAEAWPDAADADELHDARPEPPIEAPAEYRAKRDGDEPLVEIARGRLQGLGPVSAASLAGPIGVAAGQMAAALAVLQAEGSVMHGRFTAEAPEDGEWCERGLLARIHRYTVKRLRAEIEPVAPRDLLRFLLEWQRAAPKARMEGPDAVAAVLAQLEGFEAPAGAWETEILPARINEYDPAWLDEQCLAGRFVWTRLARRRAESGPVAGPVRGTPIALLGRRHLRAWAALAGAVDAGAPSAKARRVLEHLSSQGASFFDEIVEGSGLLPAQAEEGLAELVALGLVNSDSFGGLRALLVPSERRRSSTGPRRRRRALFGMDSAGRWA